MPHKNDVFKIPRIFCECPPTIVIEQIVFGKVENAFPRSGARKRKGPGGDRGLS